MVRRRNSSSIRMEAWGKPRSPALPGRPRPALGSRGGPSLHRAHPDDGCMRQAGRARVSCAGCSTPCRGNGRRAAGEWEEWRGFRRQGAPSSGKVKPMLITIYAPNQRTSARNSRRARRRSSKRTARWPSALVIALGWSPNKGCRSRAHRGTTYIPDAGIRDVTEPCDTLIVLGSYGVPAPPSADVTHWLREQALQSRRYGSTCTGAFLLAEAELLTGRRARPLTGNMPIPLAANYSEIKVEADRIFVRDGPVFSAAGVSAAIDLAFALIEEDHGRPLALWGGTPAGCLPEATRRPITVQRSPRCADRGHQPHRHGEAAHPRKSAQGSGPRHAC